MHDIATYSSWVTPALALLAILPVVWVAAFNTGPRGKTARKVLSIILRHRPPR